MKWMILHCALFLSNLYGATIYLTGDRFLETYKEQDTFVVDLFDIPEGKLQSKVESWHFLVRKDARQFIQKNFSNQIIKKFKTPKVSTEVFGKELWQVENEWNEFWESEYSQWIGRNLGKDFFVRHKIEVDCADVVVTLRWIFARINSLPAASTLAGSGVLFTHESMKRKWVNLKRAENWYEDELFLKVINYLNSNTYTKTLHADTYPFALNSENFDVGALYLTSGHVEIISEVNRDGLRGKNIFRLGSTTPKDTRSLHEVVMLEQKIVSEKEGGLVKFLWPIKYRGKWSLISDELMPGFSKMQYDKKWNEGAGFSANLLEALDLNTNSFEMIKWAIVDGIEYIKFRNQIVMDGFSFCKKFNCVQNRQMRGLYSTTNRDKKLLNKLDRVFRLVDYYETQDENHSDYLNDNFLLRKINIATWTMTVSQIYQNLLQHKMGHDPVQTLMRRWGL